MTSAELNAMMLEAFGEEQLTYANKDIVERSNLSNEVKDFLLSAGLPNGFCLFRFFMNPVPAVEDMSIVEFYPDLAEDLYIFGTKLFSPFVYLEYKPEHVELDRNSNLQDMARKIQELDEENIYRSCFEDEISYSLRICIDTKNNDRIICLNPNEKDITFINTNIQLLARSILAYAKCESTQEFIEDMLHIDPQTMVDNQKWWKQMTYELDEQFLYMAAENARSIDSGK